MTDSRSTENAALGGTGASDCSTWTSQDVTTWLDEYYSERPQLTPPDRGVLGYRVPTALQYAMARMVGTIKSLTSNAESEVSE